MNVHESAKLDLLDRLAEEFAERFRRGERPALAEYIARHPELADEIRELFPAVVQVEHAERDRRDPAPPQEALPLRQLGGYRILRQVGRGGMGVVYEAEHQALGRRVALKVLPLHAGRDAKALLRFRREARAAARLHHTNIVPVFEAGQDGDVCFYAMQFIRGLGLDQVIDELRRLRAGSGEPRHRSPDSLETQPGDSHALSQAAQQRVTGRFVPAPAGLSAASEGYVSC